MAGQHSPTRAARQTMYFRRRVGLGVAITLVIVLIWFSVTSFTKGHAAPTTTTIPSTTTSTHPPTTTTTMDEGLLPQTPQEPSVDPASLFQRLTPLWTAIQQNSPSVGAAIFFPESAYLQMKNGVLANPAGDYQSRLVAFFNLDLAAYSASLGVNPSSVVLRSINVNPSYATWIPPGSCENTVGYWHLPNLRLVYSTNGTVASFAVASLISWRGEWYVVHLGPNPRPTNTGTVDQPAAGPGTPGPPGGC